MFLHFLYTIEGLVNLTITLKTEGDGNDTHSEDTQLFADASDDGGSTCSGAATHSSGDKCHTGTVTQHVSDVVYAFLCCLTGLFWFVTRTKTFLS